MVSKKEFTDLQNQVIDQAEDIKVLKEQIKSLNNKIRKLDAEKSVASHVSEILKENLDSISQYTRRPCLIVEGIPYVKGESIDDVENAAKKVFKENFGLEEEEIENELDKAHRVGPVFNGGDQKIIVKFKSHKFKEKVFKEKKANQDEKIKIKPSLTKRRNDLLSYARDLCEGHVNIHFVFADCHGNLKIRTRDRVNNRFVFGFNNELELSSLLVKVDKTIGSYRDDYNTGDEES